MLDRRFDLKNAIFVKIGLCLDDVNRRFALSNIMSEVRSKAKNFALQDKGQEVIEEIRQSLRGLRAVEQQQKLEALEIPQAWKAQIFDLLRQDAVVKGATGQPIAALEDLRGPTFQFVSQHLPIRLKNLVA